jgi:triphosphoribosyl-dephospho-CoA synthetase
MESKFVRRIAQLATKALLYEVSATPKPGLVDRNGPGIHTDMDFFTFLDSACVLIHYFEDCARVGEAMDLNSNHHYPHALPRLKTLGMEAEHEMLKATKGVNTHKGLIFSLGLMCTATAAVISKLDEKVEDWAILVGSVISGMMAPHMSTQLKELELGATYGAKHYAKTGALGARGEALKGYRLVTEMAYPLLKKCVDFDHNSLNEAMLVVLLHIIVELEDSNVLGRRGSLWLQESQLRAKQTLEDMMLCSGDITEIIVEYLQWSLKSGISHGGAADMLALACFLFFVDREL